VPDGVLFCVREAGGDQIALAVRASLDHLRPWMPWATEAAAQIVGGDHQRGRDHRGQHLRVESKGSWAAAATLAMTVERWLVPSAETLG
jgi:hypothetical protein